MGNPFDPMNIILLVFAVVAFIRLRATLGKRTGNEDPLDNKNIFQPLILPLKKKSPQLLRLQRLMSTKPLRQQEELMMVYGHQ